MSISGSAKLVKDCRQETQLTTEQAGKEKELKSEIVKIRDTDTYKNVVWDGAGKTSKILNDEGKALVKKRETELDSLRKTYQAKTQHFEATQASNIKTYNWAFGIFEVLFLLFTVSSHYYKRQSAIEAEANLQYNRKVRQLYSPRLQRCKAKHYNLLQNCKVFYSK